MAYQFDVAYKPTAQLGNADGRLASLPDADFDSVESRNSAEISCCVKNAMNGLRLTNSEIRKETLQDSTLKVVLNYVQRSSWPSKLGVDDNVRTYFNQKTLFGLKMT